MPCSLNFFNRYKGNLYQGRYENYRSFLICLHKLILYTYRYDKIKVLKLDFVTLIITTTDSKNTYKTSCSCKITIELPPADKIIFTGLLISNEYKTFLLCVTHSRPIISTIPTQTKIPYHKKIFGNKGKIV